MTHDAKDERSWPLWLVTLGGAGLLPGAPGTWGSAATAVVLYFTGTSTWILLAGLILCSAVCLIWGAWAQEFFGRKDPGPVVADEGAGICLTMLLQPPHRWALVAGFLAFRLFDITKPPPVRQLEKLPAGWGILADDLAAAVYANLLCRFALGWLSS